MKTKTVKKIASILVATALLCPMYVASVSARDSLFAVIRYFSIRQRSGCLRIFHAEQPLFYHVDFSSIDFLRWDRTFAENAHRVVFAEKPCEPAAYFFAEYVCVTQRGYACSQIFDIRFLACPDKEKPPKPFLVRNAGFANIRVFAACPVVTYTAYQTFSDRTYSLDIRSHRTVANSAENPLSAVADAEMYRQPRGIRLAAFSAREGYFGGIHSAPPGQHFSGKHLPCRRAFSVGFRAYSFHSESSLLSHVTETAVILRI